ncbi:hypothetical protein VTO73DRAFT_2155 [Trametes versicolor]
MHSKFIIIPTSRFLKSYMPAVRQQRGGRFTNIFQSIPVTSGKEVKMYQPLIDALNKANLCPGFTFATTHSRGDPSEKSNEAVSVGMYPSHHTPRASTGLKGKIQSPQKDWSFVEICIECGTEPEALDPFDERNDDDERTTEHRKDALGQILSYAQFVLTRQQRTCIYIVLLLGDLCRLVRFDRSGAIVSEKFNYKTNGGDLIEFFWRYARCDAATRGHDPSAERIDPTSRLGKKMLARGAKKEPARVEDYIREMFAESLNQSWSWWKLRVDGECGNVRHFLVGEPNFKATGVAGRGTRGYVALDADNIDGQFYYLKDAWRVVSPHVDKEGKTLQFLNKKGVLHVPTLECHGDIATPTEQITDTPQLWEDLHKDDKLQDAICPFKKHKHYRIVVKEVGQPMSEFTHGRQLVFALWCCIHAHWKAYEAGIIHRDISAGNVLRRYDQASKQWCGLLIDWEWAKNTKTQNPGERQLDRTGTWQFMSVSALQAPRKEIVVEDELESFFHVLLFFAIRFLHHNCGEVANFMDAYFEDYSMLNSGRYGCGAFKTMCMKTGRIMLDIVDAGMAVLLLEFTWPPPAKPAPAAIVSISADPPLPGAFKRVHPLNYIIMTILKWIQAHYSLMAVTNPGAYQLVTTAPEDDPEVVRDHVVFPSRTQRRENRAVPNGRPPSPSTLEAQQALAQNLHTHHALLRLFEVTLQGDPNNPLKKPMWPMADKTKDQLLEKGCKSQHGADVKANTPYPLKQEAQRPDGAPGAGPSRKRGLDQVEQPSAQESPKRQKSATRKSARIRKLRGST